jgi:chaperonin GroES
MNQIKPIGDRVLIEPKAPETQTASGIIIPESTQQKTQFGTVISVGNGKQGEPLTVKEGDSVIYEKYAGTEMKLGNKEYLLMREEQILAIL